MEMFPKLAEINAGIATLARALSQTPDNHPRMRLLLACLADAHYERFELLGEPDDLEKAIEYRSTTLALTPDDDPGLSELLFNLGAVYSQRFQLLGDRDDIEKAVECGRLSVDLATDDDSALALRLANLGTQHSIQFQDTGKLTDLEDAVQYLSRALALTPDGDPILLGILINLGASHIARFEHLGELKDVEHAINHMNRALTFTPCDHPGLPGLLQNLGTAHMDQFERLGELNDLQNAVLYDSCALAFTPDGHRDLPSRLLNLGVAHKNRYERLGEPSDLERAMEYQSRALALTPDGHPQLPNRLTNLGACHRDQFMRTGELSDVEKAIEYQSRAIALTPEEHPALPGLLDQLSESYSVRFERLGEQSNLDNAMEHRSRALALAPTGHPFVPQWQSNHATTHLDYYLLTADNIYLQHSLDLLRSASQSLYGAPRHRIGFAQRWANLAYVHDSESCMEAYQTAINLLPQFIWLGVTTSQRYEDILVTNSLAVDAASAAIRFSDYSLALEWLEHARCIVWSQSLMLRSPLDKLQSVHPDIGTRLQEVANQLHSAASESRESRALASGSMRPEQLAQEHRRLANEYDDLLARIRKLPGFDDFLQPMKAKSLVQAARTGPVVVINCNKDRCDALLILPGEQTVGHVPLPNFSTRNVQQACQTLDSLLRCKGIRERGVKVRQEPGHENGILSMLATLWYDIVKPILDRLGCMNNDPADSLLHITWCPTGPLSFLPLHAAGDYAQPRSRVFDYVVSSYTPTLTALLASSPDSLSTDCRVLAIGQANTPGHSALPGTTRELAHVRAHTSKVSQYSQLMGSQATVPAVLDAMEQHDWVHLACHAHQNVSDPTKSGFFLHDGTLNLATINRRSFKGKGLAFLSACQTATGDAKLANEVVHLASGMLMAGYTSVIATMWSVHDGDAPLVADKVYARLMEDRRLGMEKQEEHCMMQWRLYVKQSASRSLNDGFHIFT
ncbi:aromatic di-alanine and TPR containing protein, putative [Rhizoctonia solani AG-3 Rhs1AP]|uniref:Aromatic di-alanine and TPR containing protein, putative n=1 Tax=Rhizoctonia solani AG-3 Rhs1AP TaxID=1086054 RepID=X8J6J7_9AGAM|nr:aromatic di-alanine and TPR containing protein, putative [Rhizoctonia solani AG-3 Rhs1AP]